MEKVSWQDQKTNEEVPIAVGEQRCVVQEICNRKKELDRTCCSREQFVKVVTDGRMVGKKPTRSNHVQPRRVVVIRHLLWLYGNCCGYSTLVVIRHLSWLYNTGYRYDCNSFATQC